MKNKNLGPVVALSIVVIIFLVAAFVVTLKPMRSVRSVWRLPIPSTSSCAPSQHSCPCATGSYCLFMGGMCLNPTAPCPGQQYKK